MPASHRPGVVTVWAQPSSEAGSPAAPSKLGNHIRSHAASWDTRESERMSGVQRQGCITRSTASREVEEDVEKALEGATVSCQQQVLFHEEKLEKGDGSSVG